jgi:hypothetical protein
LEKQRRKKFIADALASILDQNVENGGGGGGGAGMIIEAKPN